MKYNTIFIGGPKDGYKMLCHINYETVMRVAEMPKFDLSMDYDHIIIKPKITQYYQHKINNTYIYVVEGMTLDTAISILIGRSKKPTNKLKI